jgi:hypothetical protein
MMTIDTFHYLENIRTILQPLPGIEEYRCFGTPAFRIRKKLLAHIQEDGETIAIHCRNRDEWIRKKPAVFFVTDHFRNYPSVLARLNKVNNTDLTAIFYEAWRSLSPKKLIRDFDDQYLFFICKFVLPFCLKRNAYPDVFLHL